MLVSPVTRRTCRRKDLEFDYSAFLDSFPTYTDKRSCALCNINGTTNDGSNFCASCQNYLCLTCVKTHGTRCGVTTNVVDINDVTDRGDMDRIIFERSGRRLSTHVAKREAFTNTKTTDKVDFHRSYVENGNVNDPSTQDCIVRSLSARQEPTEIDCELNCRRASATVRDESNTTNDNKTNQPGTAGTPRSVRCRNSQLSSGVKRPVFSGKAGVVSVGSQVSFNPRNTLLSCSHHPALNVENYCKVHDALCCEDCLSTEHKICTVQPIDEVAHGIRSNSHLKEIIVELERVNKESDNMAQCLTHRLNRLSCQTEENLQTDGDGTVHQPIGLNQQLTTCKCIQTNMALCLGDITNAMKNGTDVVTFVALKKNQPLIVKSRSEFRALLDVTTVDITQCKHYKASKNTKQERLGKVHDDKILEEQDGTGDIRTDQQNLPPAEECKLHANHVISNEKENKAKELNVPKKCVAFDDQDDNVNTTVATAIYSRPSSTIMDKLVAFDKGQTSKVRPAVKTTKRGKVTTYGIVSDFYINEIKDSVTSHENPVLRLQSAPPERQNHQSSTKTKQVRPFTSRPSEMQERDVMLVWQNRKLLEAVTRSTSMEGSDNLQKHVRVRPLTPRERRDTIQKLQQGSKKNTETLRRSHSPTKGRRSTYKRDTGHPRSVTPVDVNAAPNATPNDMRNKNENTGVTQHDYQLLTMREASNIKPPHPERTRSAATYRSPEEAYHYHSQQYARQPRTKLVLIDQQIIRLPEDKRTCEVSGIACMPDGIIVLSDFSNKSIKLFRPGWGKVSVLYLDEPPHGVSSVSNATIVAINGIAFDRLLVIKVDNELSIRDRFKVGCTCKAVSSHNCHVYLLCVCNYSTEIRILNTDGVVSIRLRLGHIVQTPSDIAVNPLTGVIYVTDKNLGVNAITTGKVVERTTDCNLDGYHGVTVDLNGNVLVCTQQPGGVHEVSYDGNLLMPVLLGCGVEDARALCYNTATNQLVVGCSQGETIQIYKMYDQLVLRQK